jgi:hypothetical protein
MPVIRANGGDVAGIVMSRNTLKPEQLLVAPAENIVAALEYASRAADVTLLGASTDESTPAADPGPLRVFVSSPYSPRIEPYRQAVAEVCDQLGMVTASMDGIDPITHPLEREWSIAASDVFVLLLADRYGRPPAGERHSYTELEYDQALEFSVPVLAFVAEPRSPLRASFGDDDPDSDPEAARPVRDAGAQLDAERLLRFTQRLVFHETVASLADLASFRQSLTQALTQLDAARRAAPGT